MKELGHVALAGWQESWLQKAVCLPGPSQAGTPLKAARASYRNAIALPPDAVSRRCL